MNASRKVVTASTSRADDLAFLALRDVCSLPASLGVLIVGGHMVAMHALAYPSPGITARRTIDADAGITTEVASSGLIHKALLDMGYEATSGNSYTKGQRVIDLLVPSDAHEFGAAVYGGRSFDSVPGLRLALAGFQLSVELEVVLTDGTSLASVVSVPGLESATILKVLAYESRMANRDKADLLTLLQIKQDFADTGLGPWKLSEPQEQGIRLDAQRAFSKLLRDLKNTSAKGANGSALERIQLEALIREHVALPATS